MKGLIERQGILRGGTDNHDRQKGGGKLHCRSRGFFVSAGGNGLDNSRKFVLCGRR